MAADWRTWILDLQPQVRLFEAAAEAELAGAEQAIGGAFPPDVRGLLSQTNGVLDEWAYGPVLPLSRLVEATLSWRAVDLVAEYDSPDISLASFVTLGTDAGGGPFGFFTGPEADGRIHYLDAEEGVFSETSYRLEEYLEYYLHSLSSFSD